MGIKRTIVRVVSVILLLMLSVSGYAQKQDKKGVANAMGSFDVTLIAKDSVALKKLLHDELSYGHSNGWIETKSELVADLYNGKLTYKKIKAQEPEILIEGNSAWARTTVEIDVMMDGKAMSFNLKVLQVWVWKNKRWELFARQSVKM